MLKVEKYGEKRPVVRLRLIEDANGVHLVAVNETGVIEPSAYLISFAHRGDGKLILHSKVSADLGFDLDEQGVIKTMVR